jgi:hypothetical protein
MPLTVNVGLSRKASRNYQSTGRSINITAELDAALLARPDELQRQIERLYGEAETALKRQAARPSSATASDIPSHKASDPAPRNSPRPPRTDGDAETADPPMTSSQIRAIHAIARRLGIDPVTECASVLDRRLEALTIREASRLIDHLQSLKTKTPEGAPA